MSNNRLRVFFVGPYPYINSDCAHVPHLRVEKNCPRPGFSVELIVLLANYLNLTIDVTGFQANDDDDDLFDRMIERNETDLITQLYQKDSNASGKYESTFPFVTTITKVAVRRVDNTMDGMFDFFNVYPQDIWILLLSVFVTFTVFGMLVRYVEQRLLMRKKGQILEIAWKFIRAQLFQFEDNCFHLTSGRIALLIFSVFQILVIMGLFQGLILSNIIRKANPIPFKGNDLPDLIKNGKFQIVTSNSSWYYNKLMKSSESPFYDIRENLKPNSIRLVNKFIETFKTINEEDGTIGFIDENDIVYNGGFCNLVYVDIDGGLSTMHLFFRDRSHLVKQFNNAIRENMYKIQLLHRKYWGGWMPFGKELPAKCEKSIIGPTPLSITPYLGLLFIFLIGILSACFVFIGELLRPKHAFSSEVDEISVDSLSFQGNTENVELRDLNANIDIQIKEMEEKILSTQNAIDLLKSKKEKLETDVRVTRKELDPNV